MNNKVAGLGILVIAAILNVLWGIIWLCGSSNVETPAGYVGYVTQSAVFGETRFIGLQTGPKSSGKTWMYRVINIRVTPNTYSEDFGNGREILSQDNLKIGFSVHITWNVQPDKIKEFVERYSEVGQHEGKNDDTILKNAYEDFLKEPLRTYARDEIQKLAALHIKDNISEAGDAIFQKVLKLTKDTPFNVTSVVVGNIQYPEIVSNSVAEKMAMTQVLERKKTEIEIEKQEALKKVTQAEGIAKAMDIINQKLTPQYLQHEAIEAQKSMVNSPNRTVVYIPVGNMGVPLTGTFDVIPKDNK